MEDKEIVQLVWDRKEEGLIRMSGKYGDYCFSISCRIVKNPEDARECVNDIWFNVWN